MNISHVSLVMTKDSDLMVYKNKGRPTKAETESIEVNGDLRKELGMLKRKMKYKDGTDILLAVSIASDEMIRAFHIFPEVAYLTSRLSLMRKDEICFSWLEKTLTG